MSYITFDNETDRRIEYNRLKMNNHKKEGESSFSESDFRRYLFMLGLMDYEYRILPEITGEPYKPYYSIQGEEVKKHREVVTVPAPTYTRKKIIPFPGVSLHVPDSFQDEVDSFLQEMGYID